MHGFKVNTSSYLIYPTCHLTDHSLMIPFAGVSCDRKTIVNARLNTTDAYYQTYVNISCDYGFEMNADQYWVVTQCQADKTWSVPPTNCTRKSPPCNFEVLLKPTDREASDVRRSTCCFRRSHGVDDVNRWTCKVCRPE